MSAPLNEPRDEESAGDPGPPPPLWLSYLQLLRLPNVFSAIADVAAGFVFVQGSLAPIPTFATLAAASACLYLAGMVLNDVYDLETDRRERPERPLPAGRIPVAWARMLGFLLLVAGVALGWLAGYVTTDHAALPWRSGAIATVLAACVLLYDAWAKETWLGPVVMGLCRMLNLLLGMSVANLLPRDETVLVLGFAADHLLVAGGMGLYIAGITIFARDEAGESNPLTLGLGSVVMLAGIVLVGLFPHVSSVRITAETPFPHDVAHSASPWSLYTWWLLLAMLALTNARRCFSTLLDPTPDAVRIAVVQSLMSIILYDAAIAMAKGGPEYGLGIAVLLAPAWLLGRVVYST